MSANTGKASVNTGKASNKREIELLLYNQIRSQLPQLSESITITKNRMTKQ